MSILLPNKNASTQTYLLKSVEHTTLETIALQNLGFQVRVVNNQVMPHLPMHTIQAEAIRAALWMHSSEGTQPVHINRVLRAALRLMKPIWANRGRGNYANTPAETLSIRNVSDNDQEDAPDEPLDGELYEIHREALNELEIIGDIAELPNGYWLPAPLRTVVFSAIQRWMLIGGRPTHRLQRNIQEAIEHTNFVRFFTLDPKDMGLVCAMQSEAAWRRIPSQPLREWARQILDKAELTADQQVVSYEFYAPSSFRSRLQYHRWTSAVHTLLDGHYLTRCTSKVGMHYRIAEVRQGKMIAVGPMPSDGCDHRRLRYGIDALMGCPVKVDVGQCERSCLFQLGNDLPVPEHRLFTALGRLQLNSNGDYYPRVWEIPLVYARQAEEALRRLEVDIQKSERLLNTPAKTPC